jgi:hypothetical protein
MVRINEVDCETDTVELINVGSEPVDLAGDYALSDDADEPEHRTTMEGELAPGAFKLVKLDGFGLRCGDERPLLLLEGRVVDAAPAMNVKSGATLGRIPDGKGTFVDTAPTPGSANQPFEPGMADLFDVFGADTQIALRISQADLDTLRVDAKTYVEAEATLTKDGQTLGPMRVGVRLKGGYGSFRTLEQKPSFKLHFAKFESGQTAFGVTRLALNSMVTDPSSVSEWLAYALFRGVGVPVPRTGYASVTLNGESYGSYLALESTNDDAFLARHFPSSRALYEGEYGDDLFPVATEGFDIDYSDGSEFATGTRCCAPWPPRCSSGTGMATWSAATITICTPTRAGVSACCPGAWTASSTGNCPCFPGVDGSCVAVCATPSASTTGSARSRR